MPKKEKVKPGKRSKADLVINLEEDKAQLILSLERSKASKINWAENLDAEIARIEQDIFDIDNTIARVKKTNP